MPLYEYQCDACDHRFEVIQKFSDAPVDVCPKCAGTVRKLFSSPAIQFKGSGWYITDYAKKSGAPGGTAKAESGGDKSGEAKSAGESKSDAGTGSDSKSSTAASAAPSTPAPKAS